MLFHFLERPAEFLWPCAAGVGAPIARPLRTALKERVRAAVNRAKLARSAPTVELDLEHADQALASLSSVLEDLIAALAVGSAPRKRAEGLASKLVARANAASVRAGTGSAAVNRLLSVVDWLHPRIDLRTHRAVLAERWGAMVTIVGAVACLSYTQYFHRNLALGKPVITSSRCAVVPESELGKDPFGRAVDGHLDFNGFGALLIS